jgi:3-hydroxyacyl-CoA dehydrogenase/enoyl-CoA hydratase/3-hydroxybutyryl-CoA epimerase
MSSDEKSSEHFHWRTESDLDGVLWLTLDRADENTNSLSAAVLEELESIVGQLEKEPPAGLVLQSGKPGSFIVGADVREFGTISNSAEAAEFIRRVHTLFDRIEGLPFPTVVIIEGYCLGGGVELALAFDYRIARDDDSTRLGFPEIKLGIYPSFGGSARSTRQMGGMKAMEFMLSTRNLRSRAARSARLIDEIVGKHGSLRWAARRAVLQKRKSRRPGIVGRLSNVAPFRGWLANVMRKKTSARAMKRHYPAPFELIDAWEQHGNDFRAMLEEEAERNSRLIVGDTSDGLRHVFFLMERLKGFGKGSDFKARRAHVIGAGVMGGDIAAWCVLQGLEVTLQDREMKYIEPALKRATALFGKKLRSRDLVAGARSRLIPDIEGRGIARADVVIEAIFENVDAKRSLFELIEPRLRPDAILATNTSAIPLAELAAVLDRPERLIGLHFFNPVAKMPLVEVVYGKNTDEEQVRRGTAFCQQVSRLPLPVKSSPGFLVNRILAPYMLKAMQIHQEQGVPVEALDAAARDFGMPMGPVELVDTVGLDVGLGVIRTLGGDEAVGQAETLQSLVDKGKLGKKTGEGFYVWKDGKPVKDGEAEEGINLDSLGRELMIPYFEECQACLADGIVEDTEVLDAGMVFGTGFAPFRGGPMYYLQRHQNDAGDA